MFLILFQQKKGYVTKTNFEIKMENNEACTIQLLKKVLNCNFQVFSIYI